MGEREVNSAPCERGTTLPPSKKRASEVISWWSKAEDVILEATRALDGKKGAGITQLRELLADAKAKLNQEQPKEAFEFAMAILPQLEADEGPSNERCPPWLKQKNGRPERWSGYDRH